MENEATSSPETPDGEAPAAEPAAGESPDARLQRAEGDAQKYLDNWRRAEADLQNYKRRAEQERAQL